MSEHTPTTRGAVPIDARVTGACPACGCAGSLSGVLALLAPDQRYCAGPDCRVVSFTVGDSGGRER